MLNRIGFCGLSIILWRLLHICRIRFRRRGRRAARAANIIQVYGLLTTGGRQFSSFLLYIYTGRRRAEGPTWATVIPQCIHIIDWITNIRCVVDDIDFTRGLGGGRERTSDATDRPTLRATLGHLNIPGWWSFWRFPSEIMNWSAWF